AGTKRAPPDWRADDALSLDQMGDIHRALAINLDQAGNPRAGDEFAVSRTLFDQAYQIRLRLSDDDPDNPAWAFARSHSLVRIGDHKLRPEKDPTGAGEAYDGALQLMIQVIRAEPDNVTWVRELSWDLNKVGDVLVRDNPNAGLAMYEKGLCARRYVSSRDP